MDVFTCVRTRREIREFLSKEIPEDILRQILEGGRLAPSSKNTQPWHFVVVRNQKVLKELANTTPTGAHIAKAPLAIAVFMENAKLPEVDAARAVQNMVLVAWEAGVGACWITNFNQEKVKELLGAPQYLKLVTVVPFGYPVQARVSRKKIRKPIDAIAHLEKFRSPYGKSALG